nr:MAG TPA: hypothetical protein [Caudoviricetes sp.]
MLLLCLKSFSRCNSYRGAISRHSRLFSCGIATKRLAIF